MKKFLSSAVLWYIKTLAKFSLSISKPRIIGIAGTAGKSSTRNALEAILKDHFSIKTVYGNSETGIPLGILGIEIHGYGVFNWLSALIRAPFGIFHLSGTQFLIAEMGIDEPDPPKNMDYLLSILKPEIAIYLNEGSVHTMQFEKFAKGKSFNNEEERINFLITKLAEEDVKIITKSNCKRAIYNRDDPFVNAQIEIFKEKDTCELLSFGKDKRNNAYYKSYAVDLDGTRFGIMTRYEYVLHFKNFILPKAYQENFAASILVAESLGIRHEKIEASLIKNFKLPPGRSSIFQGTKDSVIIDSSYNASKIATLGFIELLKSLKAKTKRPAVFVFGDMREIGSGEGFEHEEIAAKLSGIDYVYCVGKLTKEFVIPHVRQLSIKEAAWFENSEELGMALKENLPEKAIVLVKGSQNTIFLEEAIKPVLKNKSDAKKLCRQETYWMKAKQKYFHE